MDDREILRLFQRELAETLANPEKLRMLRREQMIHELWCNNCGEVVEDFDRFCGSCGFQNGKHFKLEVFIKLFGDTVERVIEEDCKGMNHAKQYTSYCTVCGTRLSRHEGPE